jgi:hypothetical protein
MFQLAMAHNLMYIEPPDFVSSPTEEASTGSDGRCWVPWGGSGHIVQEYVARVQ